MGMRERARERMLAREGRGVRACVCRRRAERVMAEEGARADAAAEAAWARRSWRMLACEERRSARARVPLDRRGGAGGANGRAT